MAAHLSPLFTPAMSVTFFVMKTNYVEDLVLFDKKPLCAFCVSSLTVRSATAGAWWTHCAAWLL